MILRGVFQLVLIFLLVPLSLNLVSDIARRTLPKYVLAPAPPDRYLDAASPVRTKGKKASAPQPPRVLRAEGDWFNKLPKRGFFRFAWPDGLPQEASPPLGPNGGYQDQFGNEWLPVVDARERLAAWKVYLGPQGRRRASFFRDLSVVFIAPSGYVWNKEPRFRDTL